MAFLLASYRNFWHRLINKLSKKDVELGSALPPEDIFSLDMAFRLRDALGVRIEGASRSDCYVHVYEASSNTISHHIYHIMNCRVDQWQVLQKPVIHSILKHCMVKI